MFIMLLAGAAQTCFAQSVKEADLLFQEGNTLFEQNEYSAAIEKYEQVIVLGYESGALYYNLGNAYFRVKDVGHAILNYERAKKLLPDDEAVQFNLELANLLAVDRVVTPPQFFLFRYFEAFKHWLDINELTWLMLTLYSIAIFFLIVRLFLKKYKLQVVFSTITIILLVPLVSFTIILSVRAHEIAHRIEGIVMVDKVAVKSGPSEDATETFFLHVGAKVRVVDNAGEWIKISLADGKVGWMLVRNIEKI